MNTTVDHPGSSTRVWADDLNGDGKLDLLVGDSVRLEIPKKGNDPEVVSEKVAAIDKKISRMMEEDIALHRELVNLWAQAAKEEREQDANQEQGTTAKESATAETEETQEKAEEEADAEADRKSHTATSSDAEATQEEPTIQDRIDQVQGKITKLQQAIRAARKERKKFVKIDSTGFIWVYYQK